MEFKDLSVNAKDIVLALENDWRLRDRVSNLIENLVKKSKKQELSFEKLVKSSVLEMYCSSGVKLCREQGNFDIKTEDRKQFKQYYASYILNETESRILNQ